MRRAVLAGCKLGGASPICSVAVIRHGCLAPCVKSVVTSALGKVPRFCSRIPCPKRASNNAFALHWGNKSLSWIFPPWLPQLLLRIFNKISMDNAEVIVLVPWWTSAIWSMRFPEHVTTLVAMQCSGDAGKRGEFQSTLNDSWWQPSHQARPKATTPPLAGGFAGARCGLWIPWHPDSDG
ncbi:hypothetical protein BC828DRAFT_402349 [Blastocladiella britannica]|nr:hypothetical protein BC828DRAFT_402349 [Blastocladiella britannica]